MAVQTYYVPGDRAIRGSFIDEFERERTLLKSAFQAVNDAVAGASSAFDWQESVKNATNVPPGGPVVGDRYLVTAVAAGLWAGKENKIAEWNGSAWLFATPDEGAVTRNETSNKMLIFDGAAWGTWDATVDHGSMAGLGDDDHTQYQLRTEKDVANGYAGLDAGTKIAAAQIQEVLALADLTDVTTPTGTGEPVLDNSPVIVTPTIADLTNMTHDHTNAAGGGVIQSVGGGAGGTVSLGNATATLSVFGAGGAVQQTVTDLTDNSGGAAADDTIAVITNGANAGSADVGPTADAIAELSTKINAINTALKAYGIIA